MSLPIPFPARPPADPLRRGQCAEDPDADELAPSLRVDGNLALADEEPRPSRADVPALPEPSAWVETFVRVACEIGAGARPAGQLQRWTTPEVFAALARRHDLATRLPRRPTRAPAVVRAVRLCALGDGVHEASAVVVDRGRVRAVAVRLHPCGGRWRVSALEIG